MITEKSPFEVFNQAPLRQLQGSFMLVGWNDDAGQLGARVIAYLCRKLQATEFARIDLPDFFPMGGVVVEDDVVQFPETRFYVCPENNLVLFKGNSPRTEWHKFLTTLLDAGRDYCHLREVYSIGGMVSMSAHTASRELLAVANSSETKSLLQEYALTSDMSYETPPHQRPTLNSYLLWVAKNRNIPGISLWAPTPFYLVSSDDPQARKRVIEFFNTRFNLEIDVKDLDQEIIKQNERIAQLIARVPEIEHYIWKLERNLALTEEESQRLVKEIGEALGARQEA